MSSQRKRSANLNTDHQLQEASHTRPDFSVPKGILVAGLVSLLVLCWIGISQGQTGRANQGRRTAGDSTAFSNGNNKVIVNFQSPTYNLGQSPPSANIADGLTPAPLALVVDSNSTPAGHVATPPTLSEGSSGVPGGFKWVRTKRPKDRSLDWHSPAPQGYTSPQPPNIKKVALLLGLQSLTLPPLGTGELLDTVVTAQSGQTAEEEVSNINLGTSLQLPLRTSVSTSDGGDPLKSEWLAKCFFEDSTVPSAKQTAKRRVLFIGHSHSRYLGAMLCLFLNGSTCSQFSLHRRPATVIQGSSLVEPSSSSFSFPTGFLAWVQANYDLRPRLRLYFPGLVNGTRNGGGGFIPVQPLLARQLHQGIAGLQPGEAEITDRDVGMERKSESDPGTNGSSVQPSITDDLTHVVVSRGTWDLLFRDSDPEKIVDELVAGLMELHVRFPRATIILQLPHYVHSRLPARRPTQRGKLSAYQRSLWRATCFSPARVQLMRDVNLCAFHRLQQNSSATGAPTCTNSSLDRGAPLLPWLELFDVFAESKTPLANQYADALGHHYLDIMLEWMTKSLLTRHFCRAELPRDDLRMPCVVEAAFHRAGKLACEKVAAASKDFTPLEQCSCHNPAYASGSVCKGFGRHVPASTD